MSNLDKELDEILRNFARRMWSIPSGKTYGWSDEKQAILKAVEQFANDNSGSYVDASKSHRMDSFAIDAVPLSAFKQLSESSDNQDKLGGE